MTVTGVEILCTPDLWATDVDAAALVGEFRSMCQIVGAQALAVVLLAEASRHVHRSVGLVLGPIDDLLTSTLDDLTTRRGEGPVVDQCFRITNALFLIQRDIKHSLVSQRGAARHNLLHRLRALNEVLFRLFEGTSLVKAMTGQACAKAGHAMRMDGGIRHD